MAVSRTRSEDIFRKDAYPGQPDFQVKAFSSKYNSNRESGQIVKRESPWELALGYYVSLPGDATNMPIGSNPIYTATRDWGPLTSEAYRRAYGKFKRLAARPNSEVLLNVAERAKALSMMESRILNLAGLALTLKNGRFKSAFRLMVSNPSSTLRDLRGLDSGKKTYRFVSEKLRQDYLIGLRKNRNLVKDVGSIITEFNYGWLPLISDIQSALQVLSTVPSQGFIKSGVTVSDSYIQLDGNGVKHTVRRTQHVTIKGRLKIVNPLIDYANRLGLFNPISIAWEMTPWSFLIDWALPLGSYIESFTDFYGIELVDGSITGRCTTEGDFMCRRFVPPTSIKVDAHGCSVYAKKISRSVGMASLPRPPLGIGSGLSPKRAVNAIALLLQRVR